MVVLVFCGWAGPSCNRVSLSNREASICQPPVVFFFFLSGAFCSRSFRTRRHHEPRNPCLTLPPPLNVFRLQLPLADYQCFSMQTLRPFTLSLQPYRKDLIPLETRFPLRRPLVFFSPRPHLADTRPPPPLPAPPLKKSIFFNILSAHFGPLREARFMIVSCSFPPKLVRPPLISLRRFPLRLRSHGIPSSFVHFSSICSFTSSIYRVSVAVPPSPPGGACCNVTLVKAHYSGMTARFGLRSVFTRLLPFFSVGALPRVLQTHLISLRIVHVLDKGFKAKRTYECCPSLGISFFVRCLA